MHYFCTAGRGTEIFVSKELQKTLQITHKVIEITDGKVFFQCSVDDFSKLCELKTVERVFAQIVHVQKKQIKENLYTYNGIKKIIVDNVDWYDKELLHVIELLRNGSCESMEDNPDGEPLAKKRCYGDHQETRFRISCRCTGKSGRQIQPQTLSRQIGVALSKCLNWTIDLKSQDIDVNIHLNDEGLIVGIPLKRTPLSKRSYIKHFGLRSTVAWIIADIVNPKKGDLVVDPMCGKGTILLELASNNRNLHCIGIDKDKQQLQYAEENITFAGLCDHIELIQADSISALMKDGSVDKVVCDAPFGKKFHLEQEIKGFYTQLFEHVDRVLRPDGQFLLLTSSEIFKCIEKYKVTHCYEQPLKPRTSGTQQCGCLNVNTDTFNGPSLRPMISSAQQCSCLPVNTNTPNSPISDTKLGLKTDKEMRNVKSCQNTNVFDLKTDKSEVRHVQGAQNTNVFELKTDKSEVRHAENAQNMNVFELKTDKSEVRHAENAQNMNVFEVNAKLNVDCGGIIINEEKVTLVCDQDMDKSNKAVDHCRNNYNKGACAKPESKHYSEQSKHGSIQTGEFQCHGSIPMGEFPYEIDCYNLILTEHYYIKLGETDSYICVFNK